MFQKIVGLFGIALVSINTEDANSIPVPGELLWIDQIFNGHGWTDRGQIDVPFLKAPTVESADTILPKHRWELSTLRIRGREESWTSMSRIRSL